uniref:LysM domain-containing protein n=1 Tax=Entomoneis paludosa TaxID=265537 RepID=A0A7S2YIP9_9STRA
MNASRVQPHDTLQGLCLKYNVSAARIQQANLIMTHSQTSDALLLAAPELLAIPIVSRRPAAAGTTARDAAESVANGDPNEAAETGEDNAATTGTVGFYGRGSAKEDVEFYKIKTLQKEFKLGIKEAKAYLELANGVLEEARDAAREDIAWERQAQKDHF